MYVHEKAGLTRERERKNMETERKREREKAVLTGPRCAVCTFTIGRW